MGKIYCLSTTVNIGFHKQYTLNDCLYKVINQTFVYMQMLHMWLILNTCTRGPISKITSTIKKYIIINDILMTSSRFKTIRYIHLAEMCHFQYFQTLMKIRGVMEMQDFSETNSSNICASQYTQDLLLTAYLC